MFALLRFFLALFSSLFKSKSRLEAENAALRRQVIVLQRKVRGRVHFTNSDRLFSIQLYRWFPSVLKVITIIRQIRPRTEDGSRFEVLRPHHAVSCKQRFPGSLRIAPNWRGFVCAFCLCKLSIGFHVPFWRLCLCPAKSRFPTAETGVPYTLYSDGSIEAQLPEGTLRFGSITKLRNHIEQSA